MTEREKLSASLQNYYNAQVYSLPGEGWKGAAAVKKNKRRRLALWLFLVTGLGALFFALLTTGVSESAGKNTFAKSSGKTAVHATTIAPKHIANKTRLHAGASNEPQVMKAHAMLQKPESSDLDRPATAAAVKSVLMQNNEALPQTQQVAADNSVKTEAPFPSPSEIVQDFVNPSNNATDVPLNAVINNTESVSIRSDDVIQTSNETSVAATSTITDAMAMNSEGHKATSMDSTQQQITAAQTQPLSKTDTNGVDALPYCGNTLRQEIFDSTLKAVIPNVLQQQGLSLEVGAAYLLGWNTGSSRDANGFTGYGGFNFTSTVADKSAFSVGLHYFQVAGLNASTKTSTVSSYAYGETNNITQITPVALHYVLVPLRFSYLPNTKHQFGLGINLAYLLNVDANVSTYQQSPMGTSAAVERKESGYMQGFNWYDAQATLFYRRRLGKAFAIQSEVFFGVIDSKENVFFNLKGKERNSGIKLGLMYYFTTQQKQHGS